MFKLQRKQSCLRIVTERPLNKIKKKKANKMGEGRVPA